MSHRSYQAGDKECREPVINITGCRGARLLVWLILNDRVQPSCIAGVSHRVCVRRISQGVARTYIGTGSYAAVWLKRVDVMKKLEKVPPPLIRYAIPVPVCVCVICICVLSSREG